MFWREAVLSQLKNIYQFQRESNINQAKTTTNKSHLSVPHPATEVTEAMLGGTGTGPCAGWKPSRQVTRIGGMLFLKAGIYKKNICKMFARILLNNYFLRLAFFMLAILCSNPMEYINLFKVTECTDIHLLVKILHVMPL